MSIYSKDYNNQIMSTNDDPLTPGALKDILYKIISDSISQGGIWGFFNDKKVSEHNIAENIHYKAYVTLYNNWKNNEGPNENKQNVFDKAKQIVDLVTSGVKVDDDARKMSQVVEKNPDLAHVFASAEHDAKYISQLVNSNEQLEEQLKKLRDSKNKNKRTKTNLLAALQTQIIQQENDYNLKVLEIKKQTDKTMNEKTNEITNAQVALNEKIEELKTVTNSLDDKDEIIKDLKTI